jgi:hypothetical protein
MTFYSRTFCRTFYSSRFKVITSTFTQNQSSLATTDMVWRLCERLCSIFLFIVSKLVHGDAKGRDVVLFRNHRVFPRFFSESSCKQFFSSEGMSIVVKLLAENQVLCSNAVPDCDSET